MAFWYNTHFCRNVIYMFPEDGSHDLGARYMFHYKANDVITDKICYVWIQTHTRWFRTYGNGWSDLTTKMEWSSIYLTEEKCLQIKKLMAHSSFWYITSNYLSLCRYLFHECTVHRDLFVECDTRQNFRWSFFRLCVGSVRMNNMLGVGRRWMQCKTWGRWRWSHHASCSHRAHAQTTGPNDWLTTFAATPHQRLKFYVEPTHPCLPHSITPAIIPTKIGH